MEFFDLLDLFLFWDDDDFGESRRIVAPKFFFCPHLLEAYELEQRPAIGKTESLFKELKRHARENLNEEDGQRVLEALEAFELEGIAPFAEASFRLTGKGKDAVVQAVLKEVEMGQEHPLYNERFPHYGAYAAMMKTLGDHVRVGGAIGSRRLNEREKQEMRESVSYFLLGRHVKYQNNQADVMQGFKGLKQKSAEKAMFRLYDVIGGDQERYPEAIQEVVEKHRKKTNTNMAVGGALVAGGIAALALDSNSEANAPAADGKKKQKESSLSFAAKAVIGVGAVMVGWALWSKYGPASSHGRWM